MITKANTAKFADLDFYVSATSSGAAIMSAAPRTLSRAGLMAARPADTRHGEMERTLTQPAPAPGKKAIPAAGKSFKVMITVGRWKKSAMDEEYLFWDNHTYMKQLGLT